MTSLIIYYLCETFLGVQGGVGEEVHLRQNDIIP